MPSTQQQIALITGANKGIGFTLARTLARDHSFHILLGCRNPDSGASAAARLQAEGLSVEPLTIDLADDASITAAANTVQEKYGHLDVLVNNAGIFLDYGYEGSRREMWSKTFNTNVFGTALVSEAFVPLLSAAKHPPPRVVFVSSTLGSISDRNNKESIYAHVDFIAYRSSKAALDMIAVDLARKFEGKGWKVNVVCPGAVKTDINGYQGKLTTEEAMPNIVRVCTLGNEGETGGFSDAGGAVGW